jgi:hypothetical protein
MFQLQAPERPSLQLLQEPIDDDTPNTPVGEWRPAVQATLPNLSPLDSAQSRRAAFQD